MSGLLARNNAMRNPKRTASTASALMIGMAVVVVFTVFAASLRASIDDEVESAYGTSDLVVQASAFAGSGLSSELADRIAELPDVEAVAPLAFSSMQIAGDTQTPTITDPAGLAQVSDLGFTSGSLDDLGSDGIAVSESWAHAHDVETGDPVDVAFADGTSGTARVAGVYTAKAAIGDLVVPSALYEPHATSPLGDQVVLIGLADQADLAAVQDQVSALAAGYGGPKVQTRAEYLDAVGGQVNQMLTIVYVLLALAVVIAVLGIANTLALSVHERTRELGVLRAVGQTRRQLRTMVRWESVVVAVFGTLVGAGLGTLIGWGLVGASRGSLGIGTFAVPGTQLVAVAVVGAAAGVLAAVRPARRAARLDVLGAIAGE